MLSLLLALAVGSCIAGYTLVDDHGVRHAGAIPYFEVVLVLSAIPYAAAVAVTRGTAALKAATNLRAPAAGAGMVAAYLLVPARRIAGAVLVVAGVAAIAL